MLDESLNNSFSSVSKRIKEGCHILLIAGIWAGPLVKKVLYHRTVIEARVVACNMKYILMLVVQIIKTHVILAQNAQGFNLSVLGRDK